jgi:putative ABC transport system permease protein
MARRTAAALASTSCSGDHEMTQQPTRWLWWRWVARDLRRHAVAVISIALVIAIGIGVYTGLGSTALWRERTNDESFAALRMHDVRAELSPGTFADAGVLTDAAQGIEHAEWIAAVTERLVVESQVDASGGGETILVTARLVGSTFATPTTVDDVWVATGSWSSDRSVAILEMKFADYYGLPDRGRITLAGDRPLDYSGVGSAPDDFYVVGPQGSILAEADLATVYLPLATVQAIAGRAGQVDDVVLTLRPGADRDVVVGELTAALAAIDGVSATVTTRDQAEAYRVLYEDIDNDQQIWNALSALVLVAAALAAFNLISRIVDAQRREIGIGMALGLSRARLAIRPVMVGVEVGVFGALAGVGAGLAMGQVMRDLLVELLPMPEYRTPFQPAVFARGAALAVLPPLIAAVLPVWRAVRAEPITAIRTGHLAASAGRIATWSARVRLPGSSFAQMPLRNVLRAPRRVALTAIGVGAAIAAMVATLGMLDSFRRTIHRGSDQITKGDPDRITVTLDTYAPVDAPAVRAVLDAASVGTADPSLVMPGTIEVAGRQPITIVLESLDFATALWTPTLERADADPTAGIVLARKAASDLGVGPGDTITLTHPTITDSGFATVTSDVVVGAIHPNPIRNFAYVDRSFSDRFGPAGLANHVQVTPASGATRADVQRELFGIESVASAQPVARTSEVFDEALEQFVGFLVIVAGAVLLLAALIAFNSTRISVEERRREHATMMAFGVRVRRVIGVVMTESCLIGVAATIIGSLIDIAVLRWMLDSLANRTLPDIAIDLFVSPATIALAALVGVVAVSIAPLLLARRLSRMDLPDTLRVME